MFTESNFKDTSEYISLKVDFDKLKRFELHEKHFKKILSRLACKRCINKNSNMTGKLNNT